MSSQQTSALPGEREAESWRLWARSALWWWLELVLAAGLLLGVFCTRIGALEFHPDESQWIATSKCWELFVQGKVNAKWWRETYWTLTQPPLARYVIGIGRQIGGYRSADLNSAWNFGLDTAANTEAGNMPSPGLLWWSRLPMAVLAAISGLVLFGFARATAGRLAGYALLLLYASNPYLARHLGRAMGESVLLACVILAALAGERALASWQRVRRRGGLKALMRPFCWLAVMGVLSGAAAAAKLNGGTVALAGVGICALILFQRGAVRGRTRLGLAAGTCLALALAAVLTFVLLNPYLYPDPLGRSRRLLDHRLQEMQIQQGEYPQDQIAGLDSRLRVVPLRILETGAALHFPWAWVPNLLLTAAGIALAAREACRRWSTSAGAHASAAVLLACLATVVPPLLTPLDWGRYYLLPVVFSTLFISIAAGRAAAALCSRIGGKDAAAQP